jgi:PTS system nitrogen regulatory IIA component
MKPRLTDLMLAETVIDDPQLTTKPEVLAELATRAAALTHLDRTEIFRALLDRESLGSTALGKGVALPQARFRQLRRPVALSARLTRPVDFRAWDGKPVDLVFVLLGTEPNDDDYVDFLISVARALRDPTVQQQLREGRGLHFPGPAMTKQLARARP